MKSKNRGVLDAPPMALGAAGQKQRRAEVVAIPSWEGNVVGENVVQPSLSHRGFPPAFTHHVNKCELDFGCKGLTGRLEFLLAVGGQPVYKATLPQSHDK